MTPPLANLAFLVVDDNEHMAKLHVKAGDPMTGQFAVVIRDVVGGVAFQDWSMQTAPPTE